MLSSQAKFEEAEKMFQQLLGLYQEVCGPKHQNTLNVMHSLVLVLESQGKLYTAEEISLKVLELCQKVP